MCVIIIERGGGRVNEFFFSAGNQRLLILLRRTAYVIAHVMFGFGRGGTGIHTKRDLSHTKRRRREGGNLPALMSHNHNPSFFWVSSESINGHKKHCPRIYSINLSNKNNANVIIIVIRLCCCT
jgi:hypothetical protein